MFLSSMTIAGANIRRQSAWKCIGRLLKQCIPSNSNTAAFKADVNLQRFRIYRDIVADTVVSFATVSIISQTPLIQLSASKLCNRKTTRFPLILYIALSTEGSFFDENGDGINTYYTIQEYIKDGDDYVAILECDDYFEYYLLNSEIEKVGAKIQIANENLTVNSSANDDGSIHIEMSTSSEEWASVDGYVFFTDDENNIVAYEPVGGGFEDEMSDDTDIPGKEYSDYFVCVTAID